MFDPTIFDEPNAKPMPDWVSTLLVVASYALAFAAGYLAA